MRKSIVILLLAIVLALQSTYTLLGSAPKDDLKAIVEMASRELSLETIRKCFLWEEGARSEMVSKGLQMSPQPSEADTKKWMEAGMKTWSEYAEKDKFSAELIKVQTEFMQKYGQ